MVRLRNALEENAADVAVARTLDRIHPVFALYRRDLRATLGDYLASGERMVQAWQARQRRVEVSFEDDARGISQHQHPRGARQPAASP